MLLRKLLRTAWHYKAQFVSMVVMVTIGTGVFLGATMEWYSLDLGTSAFFEDTSYADYRIYSEKTVSTSDIAAVRAIDGVDNATRVLELTVGVQGSSSSLALFCPEDYGVSSMLVTEGADYDADACGFWVSDRYAAENGIEVGDELTLTYRSYEVSGEVLGLAKSSEFMICVADDNQLMPDYSAFGFAYTTPATVKKAVGLVFYPQINVRSNLAADTLKQAVADALGETTLVLSKDETYSYAGAQSEIEEGLAMAGILPELFLLIGVLTMVTTMHRIVAQEKTQIGTLKALGFTDRRIALHYTSYSLAVGLVGTVLGVLAGYGIASAIVGPQGMESTYIDLPEWHIVAPGWCWAVLAGIVVALTLVGFLSVRQMLGGTAAEALRPYTPKKMRAVALERTPLWARLGFTTRWNVRDVARHKLRMLMTLLGVLGCMLLLIGGLGMYETMDGFLGTLDSTLNYETRINLADDVTDEQAYELAERYDGDVLAARSVEFDGRAVELDVYAVLNGTVRFVDADDNEVVLGDEGVYLCERLADGVAVGDTVEFSPYGESETYRAKVAGVLNSAISENIVMTAAYAQSLDLSCQASAVFTARAADEVETSELVAGTQSKQALMDSYNSFMAIINASVFVLVAGAVILGVVVLYNLGVMSYLERYRELATLKVLGFDDARIGRILTSQNMWVTLLGVLAGLPLGAWVLHVLIVELASEYELHMVMGPLTCGVSVALTLGTSLAVSFFVARKNRKIDMVAALKCAE